MVVKQVKSNWYYVFWGIATVAVVAGQIYVGSGYREMSETVKTLIQQNYNERQSISYVLW